MKGKRSTCNITSNLSPDLCNVVDTTHDSDILVGDIEIPGDDDINSMPDPCTCIPKFALFLGLFSGPVPIELVGLTIVEESMISIYSAVTKVCLAGGKHYKLKPGSSYTIINDLTSVASCLPRMPSIEDIAVMRHLKSEIGKDYTYRPYKVYAALLWLKKNNHLYAQIDLVWGDDVLYWQDTLTNVDIPFIEITDEESNEYDDESVGNSKTSDEFNTNSGNI